MKKKLENVYVPDKGARKEKVVVGLTGGIDSFVAAYLLKIQKYDLFAVTISLSWDQLNGDKSKILNCFQDEKKLESIREFCNQLKIPHLIVKSSSEFHESVIEEWIAAKATGSFSNNCWSCHDLRMKMLYYKMKELGAKSLATGHYAKLFRHDAHDTYYVHSSNDEIHDQSALLSRLPDSILKSLMLPLSDLQRKEVLKLGENFGLDYKEAQIKIHECFPDSDSLVEYLSAKIPAKMIEAGEVMNEDMDQNFGEHEGIHNYSYGVELELPLLGRNENVSVGKYLAKEKKIIVSGKEHFMRERIFLSNCRIASETPWQEPIKGAIKLSENIVVDCWIYPKSLNGAYVEWEGAQRVLEGQLLSVFRKKGKNSKVFMTGKARYLPKKAVSSEDGEAEKKTVDYSCDF